MIMVIDLLSHRTEAVLLARILLMLSAIFVLLHPPLASAENFKIYTEEYPPYNYTENGKITGISTEIVREILHRIQHPDSIEVSPWSKAYRLIREEDYNALYSTTRAPFRENLFKWVGPLVPNNTVLFARTSDNISINSIDDARAVGQIGVYKDDYGELLLKQKGFTNLRAAPDNITNLKKLVDGEIDLWIINELTGNQMAREEGLAKQIKKVFDVKKEFMYIAFSKSTPDDTIAKWQQALDEIKADGTYAQIFSKWIMFSLSESQEPKHLIALTNEEQKWLDKHPVISIASDPVWPPMEFYDDKGVYRGITADYIALLEGKLGITFNANRYENWDSILQAAKENKIDMITAATVTSEREEYLLFTKPYLHLPTAIIVDNKIQGQLTMQDLNGKKVSVVSGYAVHQYIKDNYPGIELIPVSNTLEGLRNVAYGKSYALVANVATSSYLMETEVIPNLRIAGESGYTYNMALATRKDWPLLNTILQKALDSITPDEQQKILRKWVTTVDKPWITVEQFFIGLSIIVGILFVVGIIVWNRQLSHKVEARTRELMATRENFKNLYKTALVGLFRLSVDGTKIYAANPAFAKLFGFESDTQVIEKFLPIKSHVDKTQIDELMAKLFKEGKVEEFECQGRRLDGSIRDFILNAFLYKEEGYIEGAILDITERKKNDEIILKLAMTDPLTGLANRNRFNNKLDEAIASSNRFKQMVGLLLIDLDDFKPVNDNYGHITGDKLLIHVANVLKENFREVDTPARMGGDEFAVILNGVQSRNDAFRLAEKVLARLTAAVRIDDHSIQVGTSMGLCFFPDDAGDPEEMLHNADKALYKAKQLGKNQVCFYVPDTAAKTP
jgi:diguanylate cyclase (GGDEF)-like protein/PAS domain S-box-containing protein